LYLVLDVSVDDGGELVLAADAAGRALAELGAGLGGDLLGGHAAFLLVRCLTQVGARRADARGCPATRRSQDTKSAAHSRSSQRGAPVVSQPCRSRNSRSPGVPSPRQPRKSSRG